MKTTETKQKKQPLYIKLDRELYDLIQVKRKELQTTQIAVIEKAIRIAYQPEATATAA